MAETGKTLCFWCHADVAAEPVRRNREITTCHPCWRAFSDPFGLMRVLKPFQAALAPAPSHRAAPPRAAPKTPEPAVAPDPQREYRRLRGLRGRRSAAEQHRLEELEAQLRQKNTATPVRTFPSEPEELAS